MEENELPQRNLTCETEIVHTKKAWDGRERKEVKNRTLNTFID